jgi:hypothetical protein
MADPAQPLTVLFYGDSHVGVGGQAFLYRLPSLISMLGSYLQLLHRAGKEVQPQLDSMLVQGGQHIAWVQDSLSREG